MRVADTITRAVKPVSRGPQFWKGQEKPAPPEEMKSLSFNSPCRCS